MSDNPLDILIVIGDFYQHISKELIEGATKTLREKGVNIALLRTGGVLEIPAIIAQAERASDVGGKKFDGYVALGCVIRGETTHHIHVGTESARAIMDLTVQGLAIGNGIITAENEAQALARSSLTGKNKGREAALACLSLVEIKERLNRGEV